MAEYFLSQWSTISFSGEPLSCSNKSGILLNGYCILRNKRVTTSKVVKAEGRKITTRSGSVYYLQDIEEQFLSLLLDSKIRYDPDNPIKMAP